MLSCALPQPNQLLWGTAHIKMYQIPLSFSSFKKKVHFSKQTKMKCTFTCPRQRIKILQPWCHLTVICLIEKLFFGKIIYDHLPKLLKNFTPNKRKTICCHYEVVSFSASLPLHISCSYQHIYITSTLCNLKLLVSTTSHAA